MSAERYPPRQVPPPPTPPTRPYPHPHLHTQSTGFITVTGHCSLPKGTWRERDRFSNWDFLARCQPQRTTSGWSDSVANVYFKTLVCCWALLYSAILRFRADSLCSHVILHEWIAFYSAFLNIHWSGVLTALAWLVPHETVAILARSVCIIQPCTMSLHAKPHVNPFSPVKATKIKPYRNVKQNIHMYTNIKLLKS